MVEGAAAMQVTQGHKYSFEGCAVIAIREERPGVWIVREIDGEWLGTRHKASPNQLTPLPMKYFHGDTK
jgi:hypothetical protein